MPVAYKSGVGRVVWGRPGVFSPVTDDDGKAVMNDDGTPAMDMSFGVAFPKQEFLPFMWPFMLQAAAEDFPAVAQQGAAGAPQDYAWKYVDGDAATGHKKGKPYNEREGYAGCYVLAFTTRIQGATSYWKPSLTVPGQWDQILHTDIKTGDYVAVSGNFVSHKAKNARSKPGLYTNPQGVMLVGVGQAIINTPDAATMFGGMNYALPPGATAPGAAPAMPQGMGQPPGLPGPGMMPGQVPNTGGYQVPQAQHYQPAPQPGMPGMAPQPQYAPAHDIYQPGAMPQHTGGYPTPGAPVVPGMQPMPQQYQPAPQPQPMPGQMPPGFPPR